MFGGQWRGVPTLLPPHTHAHIRIAALVSCIPLGGGGSKKVVAVSAGCDHTLAIAGHAAGWGVVACMWFCNRHCHCGGICVSIGIAGVFRMLRISIAGCIPHPMQRMAQHMVLVTMIKGSAPFL